MILLSSNFTLVHAVNVLKCVVTTLFQDKSNYLRPELFVRISVTEIALN